MKRAFPEQKNNERIERQPQRYKLAILAWLAIYPTITLIFWVAGDFLITLILPIRTFLLTIILVPFMFYVGIPVLKRVFSKWL